MSRKRATMGVVGNTHRKPHLFDLTPPELRRCRDEFVQVLTTAGVSLTTARKAWEEAQAHTEAELQRHMDRAFIAWQHDTEIEEKGVEAGE